MAEWLKAPAWKVGIQGNLYRGFESLSLRQLPVSVNLTDPECNKDGRDRGRHQVANVLIKISTGKTDLNRHPVGADSELVRATGLVS